MTVEAFNEMLEDELTQAVEVKDSKSLHRAVVLLTGNYVQRREHEDSQRDLGSKFDRMLAAMEASRVEFREETRVLRAEFDKMLAVMKEKFEATDKRFEDNRAAADRRFEAVDKRFEDANKRFDDVNKRFDDVNRRFEDVNKRFNGVQWLLGIGFTVMAALMSLYQVL